MGSEGVGLGRGAGKGGGQEAGGTMRISGQYYRKLRPGVEIKGRGWSRDQEVKLFV